MKNYTLHFLCALLATPIAVLAAPETFKDLAEVIIQIVQGFISIIFISFSVAMIYGVVVYLFNSDNEKKRTDIKNYLLWGVIGIVVTFGLWGILQILSTSLGWGNVGVILLQPPK
jgi:hypothetical protein